MIMHVYAVSTQTAIRLSVESRIQTRSMKSSTCHDTPEIAKSSSDQTPDKNIIFTLQPLNVASDDVGELSDDVSQNIESPCIITPSPLSAHSGDIQDNSELTAVVSDVEAGEGSIGQPDSECTLSKMTIGHGVNYHVVGRVLCVYFGVKV